MDQNEKRRQLAAYLAASEGLVLKEDIEKAISKMASACPAATAAEKGLVDEIDKAYEVYLIQQGQATNPTKTHVQVGGPSLPMSGLSAEEELQIAKTLASQHDDRSAVSQNTAIDQLILDRPAPADIIKQGTKGTISEKSWKNLMAKIDDGTYTVKPDDGEEVDADKRIASTTNFNLLKAAKEAGTPVDIHIGKLSTKPIGYIVVKGSAVGNANTPVQMTRQELETYLIVDTAGFILASEKKPGAKLKYIKAKANASQAPGTVSKGKTILADANKAEAIAAGSYAISRQVTQEVKATSCKSALQFRVTVKGKTMKDGKTPLTRTIRVSLTADLPVLERKPEFLDKFGTGERNQNADLLEIPTGQQAKSIEAAQRAAIANLRQKANDPMEAADLMDIADKLKAFDAPAAQSPASVAM